MTVKAMNIPVEEENKAVVRRFYEDVFNQGHEAVIDEIIAPNYLDYGHNLPGQGIEGAKADFRGVAVYFSNAHFVIDDLITTGDQVIAPWTVNMTHTGDFMGVSASGKSVTMTGISIYRVADGKLLETRNAVTWLDLLQQLGALPV